jgi:hypothetical protein
MQSHPSRFDDHRPPKGEVDGEYRVRLNITEAGRRQWGWLHLIFGVLMVVVGMGLFGRRSWAGVSALMLCMLSAVLNFFFIPYYPLWAIIVIALDVWVIWALTRPGVVET